jgi:hypothetical protein
MSLSQHLVDLLSPLGDTLAEFAGSIPMPLVRLLFIAVFVALALWVLTLPPQRRPGVPRWRDLRYLAILVLALQSVLYLLF